MGAAQPTAHEASLLMGATLAISMIGIFIGIFYLFINIELAIRIVTAVLAGFVGIISFVRHSVYYESDQIRMGWRQEHKEFQLEEGMPTLPLASGVWLRQCLTGDLSAGWCWPCMQPTSSARSSSTYQSPMHGRISTKQHIAHGRSRA